MKKILLFLVLVIFALGCTQEPSGDAKNLLQKNTVKLMQNEDDCFNCIKNSGLVNACNTVTDSSSNECVQLKNSCSNSCGLMQVDKVTTQGWWSDAIECFASEHWMGCMRRRGWYDGQ
ncbi:MAG: hypothetical protein JW703_02790 [Candidatus Diapherotrites archaeon]|nr:hypothetical protein [Candidatus Diapherotrites archaeon]